MVIKDKVTFFYPSLILTPLATIFLIYQLVVTLLGCFNTVLIFMISIYVKVSG